MSNLRVVTVPSMFARDPLISYFFSSIEAQEANDRDVALGTSVTGFELDRLEYFDRELREQVQRAETAAMLYGDSYRTPRRRLRVV